MSAAFLQAFLPRSLRETKARQFEQLRQGEMTITEYRNKFLQLSKFAPHLVSTQQLRVSRFTYGLRDNIFRSVFVNDDTTFEQAVNMALRMEERQIESRMEQRQQKKAKGVGSTSGVVKEGVSHRPPISQRPAPSFGRGGYTQQRPGSDRKSVV